MQKFVDDRIMDWLGIWRYSSASILRKMLYGNTNNKSIYNYLNGLLDNGFLIKKDYQFSSGYELSTDGYKLISAKNINQPYPPYRVKTVKNSSTLYHDLFCQLVVTLMYDRHDERSILKARYLSEYMIDFDDMIRPDACVIRDDQYQFIECELSEKSIKRIYYKYTNQYLHAYENSHYSFYYVFNNPYVYQKYLRLFNENSWPVFDKKQSGDLREVDTIKPNAQFKAQFKFVMIDAFENFQMSDLKNL